MRAETIDQPPAVWIQLLGEFKVVLPRVSPQRQRFRSRTAERLLATLALRMGGSVHRSQLLDALWPDSDADRQSQNLRRALSDIRQVLEVDPRSSVFVRSHGERLWLDTEQIETDVQQFKRLTDAGLAGNSPVPNLRAAVELYQGPLLGDQEEPWLQVHRMELEERFGQAVEQLIAHLLRAERHDEALLIGRKSVAAAPLREDVHLALAAAYASAGLRSEAIRQFEELETLLNEQWGESPSASAVAAFESVMSQPATGIRESRVEPAPRPPLEISGGAVPAGSPFYVERACDEALRRALGRDEGTILVHGSRQVGKTSLLSRVLQSARRDGVGIAISDFQVLSRPQLATADSFSRALGYAFATQLGVEVDVAGSWNEWIGANSNLHAIVETVLRSVDGPVVWAMDEADRIFGTEFADDFFGLVRSWHNLRAMDPGGPFGRLCLIVSYATEAHLFIQDIHQSPFNVGVRIPVSDFSLPEVEQLSRRYGLSLDHEAVVRLRELTAGQPFLTRRALDAMVHADMTLDELRRVSANEDGPFGEHLRRLMHVASRDEATRDEVLRFLRGEPFQDPKTALRLVAGGMLIRPPRGGLEFRVPAYRPFLDRYLAGSA